MGQLIKMNQKLKSNNIVYCSKDGRRIDLAKDDYIVDSEGNIFCDVDCRREFWMENRRELDCRVTEFFDVSFSED